MEFAVDLGNELVCRGKCEEEARERKAISERVSSYIEANGAAIEDQPDFQRVAKVLLRDRSISAAWTVILNVALAVLLLTTWRKTSDEGESFLLLCGSLFLIRGVAALGQVMALRRTLRNQPFVSQLSTINQ
jgi:hypothetical protein